MDKSMRDDSFMYSGSNSTSFAARRPNPLVEKIKEDKKTKKNLLNKSTEIIIEFFDKEIANLQNIDYLNIESMLTDEHFKAEMMARKKTLEKLKDIKTKLSRIMETK